MASTIADVTTTPVNITVENAASASAYDPRKMRSLLDAAPNDATNLSPSARYSRPLRKPRRRSSPFVPTW
jgi:hypothetical protein